MSTRLFPPGRCELWSAHLWSAQRLTGPVFPVHVQAHMHYVRVPTLPDYEYASVRASE
jgi:hypothetical protein